MDVSGVSPEAAVMAVANQRAAGQTAEAQIAVLARIQKQEAQTAEALVSLMQQQVPASKPGVGERFSAWA
jgi:hypothetical protein